LTTVRGVWDDRFYLPTTVKNLEKIAKKEFDFHSFEDNSCFSCPYMKQRPCDACESCPAYLGITRLWNRRKYEGVSHIGFPSPNLEHLLDKLNLDCDIVYKDKRASVPFLSNLKFTTPLFGKNAVWNGTPRPNQVKVVEEWLSRCHEGGGLIKAPPRAGKTAMGVYLSCHLRQRTLITASQVDWLIQFAKTFGDFTNLKEIVKIKGVSKSPVVLVDSRSKTWEDFAKYGILVVKSWDKVPDSADVVISTYQGFISEERGKERLLTHVRDNFGFIIVDEAHQSSARCFSAMLNNCNPKYRLALTATPKRKEATSSRIVDIVCGPILATTFVSAIIPEIHIMRTGVTVPKVYKNWNYLKSFLFKNPLRNKLIVDKVMEDLLDNPLHNILIPVNNLVHLQEILNSINSKAQIYKSMGHKLPLVTAIAFHGKVDRDRVLTHIKEGHSRVMVAIESMVKHGLDVPAWTHVYVGINPTSNGPMFYQLANRVCTPAPNKPQPVVRILTDSGSQTSSIFKKLWYANPDGINSGLSDKDGSIRYRVAESSKPTVKFLLSN
jgi:superfamily II DNA or RNA helicase